MIRKRSHGFDQAFASHSVEHGQLNREPAALADCALHAHPAAVGFDDVFDDAQADADALGFAAQLGAAAVEALEDLRCSSGGMPGP